MGSAGKVRKVRVESTGKVRQVGEGSAGKVRQGQGRVCR